MLENRTNPEMESEWVSGREREQKENNNNKTLIQNTIQSNPNDVCFKICNYVGVLPIDHLQINAIQSLIFAARTSSFQS